MHLRIALSTTFLLLFLSALCWAADAPSPAKPGPKAEEFRRLQGEMNALLGELAGLQVKYRTADEEKQNDIRQQWKELIAKGEKMEPKLVEAAKNAYADAPNADPQVTDLLVQLLTRKVRSDDYEPAAEIGKLLMENKCSDKRVPLLAGVAALAVSDYDDAQPYLQQAAQQAAESRAPLETGPNRQYVDQGLLPAFLQAPARFKENWAKEKAIREKEAKADDLPRVLLKTTKGDIEIELFEDQAPNTVANFIHLVQKGFYKDVVFHRVLPAFMAQGGDPTGTGGGGPGYSIADECRLPEHRLHFRGSLSMAKTAAPDTGGSQFFLTFLPTVTLDGAHTVFGRVIDGMNVLAKIQRRDPEDPEAPRPDKIIEAKVLRKRSHPYVPQKMPE